MAIYCREERKYSLVRLHSYWLTVPALYRSLKSRDDIRVRRTVVSEVCFHLLSVRAVQYQARSISTNYIFVEPQPAVK